MTAPLEEISTITAKGQTTVPKAVRNALGVGVGSKIAFKVENGRVTVSRLETPHRDPALGNFLKLIEQDIKTGRNVRDLPAGMAVALKRAMDIPVDLEEPLEGDVVI
jgi:antitoxin PrlF